jgi:uncharacterized surface protein with fasciclin (FAS1) repeats
MKKLIAVLAIAMLTGVATAAPQKDIVDTAVSAGSFNTLVAAVKAAGLVTTLKGTGPFTVFAPTDQAVAKLPPGTVDSLLKPENRDKLRAILTYHVVAGRIDSKQIAHMSSAKTVEGSRLTFKVVHGEVMVNGAKVVEADVSASNGVIHAIDNVLMPPSQ